MLLPKLPSGALLAVALVTSAAPGVAHASPPAMVEALNAARTARGVPPLRPDRRLARAALEHSSDMVAHRYFAHGSRSGERFSTRIARTGWMRGRAHWRVGETLAWGRGRKAAARDVVAAWLASPAHRRIVLEPGFHVVGIGAVTGTPFGGAGRTYTADFGS